MRVDILTLFPAAFTGPLDVSILRRAREAGLLDLAIHDIRAHATDRHQSVDDYPFGGGQGMVMRVDVLVRALEHVSSLAPEPPHVIYFTPQGERINDRLVRDLATRPRLALVCGRYEGVDERFVQGWVHQEVSLGDFILTGGELPAMVLVDAVARHIPGALGDEQSPEDESFADGLLEFPHYTRPPEFRGRAVPPVLLSGDHAAIERWRHEQRLLRTAARRPGLAAGAVIDWPAQKASGVRIRTANESDLAAANALWGEALPEPVRDPDLFIVAAAGRRIVAAALSRFDGRQAHLDQLAVHPGFRGRGIARALLQELEHRLRLKGCARIGASLPPSAPGASAFLQRLGWSPVAGDHLSRDLPPI